jgi:uncharacterized protein YjeT (DUF2065 family)
MNILDVSIGIFLLVMGFGFLYFPVVVQKMNVWIRENIFSDRMLLTHRRRAGVLLIFMGAIIIYFVVK